MYFLILAAACTALFAGHTTSALELNISDPPCGGDYVGLNGSISTPNYPSAYLSNTDCYWTIKSENNSQLRITFEDFDTENGPDYLEIRDGNDSNAPLIVQLHGKHSSIEDVFSRGNSLYLHFHSDYSAEHRGFKLQWTAIDQSCGGEFFGLEGDIVSPFYPTHYFPNADCYWTVRSANNTELKVFFEDFVTQSSYDYLDIRDGNDSSAPQLVKLSGSNLPEEVISTGRSLFFHFHSDGSHQYSGFRLNWTAVDRFCDADYKGLAGTIVSPNYPHQYLKNVDCQWTVTSEKRTELKVIFDNFNTYDDKDYLVIRDGMNSTAPELAHLSGDQYNIDDVFSTGNSLYFHFHTDSTNQRSGFNLTWTATDLISCYYCDNSPEMDSFDPLCGEDIYHGVSTPHHPTSCYTNVHYDGLNRGRVERGYSEYIVEDETCHDTGFSSTCFCKHNYCNNNLCQNCTTTTTPSPTNTQPITTTTQPAITTMPTTIQPATTLPVTTITFTTPSGALECYSCMNCETINEETNIKASDEFLACFIAVEPGNVVIRGGSPDNYEDGLCHESNGAFVCYCTSNRCNSDTALVN